jgi:hypothetical protein
VKLGYLKIFRIFIVIKRKENIMPSLLDAELEVTEDLWIVALVRTIKGDESGHCFILVEGKNAPERTELRRYDLYVREGNYHVVPKDEGVADALARKKLLKDFLKNEVVQGKIWQISKAKADQLHESMHAAKRNPESISGMIGPAPVSSSPGLEEKMVDVGDALGSGNASALLANSVFKAHGNYSFKWSRAMLQQLNTATINNSLPARPEDLTAPVTEQLAAQESVSRSVSESGTKCVLL